MFIIRGEFHTKGCCKGLSIDRLNDRRCQPDTAQLRVKLCLKLCNIFFESEPVTFPGKLRFYLCKDSTPKGAPPSCFRVLDSWVEISPTTGAGSKWRVWACLFTDIRNRDQGIPAHFLSNSVHKEGYSMQSHATETCIDRRKAFVYKGWKRFRFPPPACFLKSPLPPTSDPTF